MKSAFVVSILCLCIGTVLSRPDDLLWRQNSRQEPHRDLIIEEIKLPSRGHQPELKNRLSDLHGNSKLRRLSESSNAPLNVLALDNILESLQNHDIQQAKGSRQELIDIEIENRPPSITLAEKISLRDRDNLKDSRRGLSRLENTLNLLRNHLLDRNVRQNKNSQPVVIDEEVEIIVPKSRGRHKSSLLQLDDLQTTNQNSLVVENLLHLLRNRNSDRDIRENKNSQLKVIDEKVEILVPKSRRQKSSLRQLDDLQNSNQNLLELENALDLLRKRNLDREVRDNKDSQLEIIDKEVEIIVPKSRRQKSSSRNSLDHENVLDLLRKRNLDRKVRENKDSQLEVIDEKIEIIVPNSRRHHKSSLHQLDNLQNTNQNSLDLENALNLLRKRNLDREIQDNKDSQQEVIDEKVEIIVPNSRNRHKSSLHQLDNLQNTNQNSLDLENALDLLRNRNLDREIRENKNSQVKVIDEKVEVIVPKARRQKSSLHELGESNDAKTEIENVLHLLRNRDLNLNSDPIRLPKTLRHSSRHADSYNSQTSLLKLAEIIGVPKSVVVANLITENPSNGLSSKLNSGNERLKITEIVELLKPKIKGHKQNEIAFLKDIFEDPILKLDEVISKKRSILPRLRISADKNNDLDIEDARIEAAKIVEESRSEIIGDDHTSILELVELIANERKPSVRLSSGLDIENARLKVDERSRPKSVRITKEQRIPSKTIVSKHASRTPYEIDVVSVEERDGTKKKVLPNLSLVIQTPESPISKHDSSVLRNSIVANNAILDGANAVSAAASVLASAGSPERSREHSASINDAVFIASSAAHKAASAATLAAEAAASAAQAMAYVIDSSDKNSDNPPLVISAETLVAAVAALADAQASKTRAETVAITSANTASKHLDKAVNRSPIHIPTNKKKVLAKKVTKSNAESSLSSASAAESSSVASSSSATSSLSSSELLQPKNHHRELSKFESDIILASLALAQAQAAEAKSADLGSATAAAATTNTGSGGSGSGTAASTAATSNTVSGSSRSGAAAGTSNTSSGGSESEAVSSVAATSYTGSGGSGSGAATSAAASSNTGSGASGSGAATSAVATSTTASSGTGSGAATSAAASSNTGSGASGSGAATSTAATSAAATSNTASGNSDGSRSMAATSTAATSAAATSAAATSNTGSSATAAESSSSSSSATSSLSSSELHQSKNNRRKLSKLESDIILASLALAQAQAAEAKSQANSFVVTEQIHKKSTLPLLKSPKSHSFLKSPGSVFGTDRTNGLGSGAATSTSAGLGSGTAAVVTTNTGSSGSGSSTTSTAAATTYKESVGSRSGATTSTTGSSGSGSGAATSVAATSNTGSSENTATENSGSEGAASAAATSNIASGASNSDAAASTSITSSAADSSGTESVAAASTAATSNTGSSDSGSGAAASAAATSNTESGGIGTGTAVSTAASSDDSETGAATSTMDKSNNSGSPTVTSNTSSTASSSQSGSSSAVSTASSTTTGSGTSSASSSITSLSNSNVGDTTSKFPDKDSSSPKIMIIETEDKDPEEVVIVVGTHENENDDQD